MLFAFNSDAQVKLAHIGRGGIAVTMIDNVLEDPEGVAALGFAQSYAEDPGNLYPGVRAAMPESFSIAFRAWLTPILRRNGVLEPDQTLYRDSSFFSVVTTASKDLLPIQRIPHYDSINPGLLAAVIYLCDTRFSGTSFYRHRRTGYEEITAGNQENYRVALNSDMRVHGAPRREYMNGDNLLFEVIYSNELKFNSAIIYPAGVLHAASIDRLFQAPRDRKDWRLTVTALLQSVAENGA
ncbi:MAG: hypothetical protein JO042_14255 [Sinobacteraceae bacterium]|nr:hypothetical protein [Nevskiaceae bacterium]